MGGLESNRQEIRMRLYLTRLALTRLTACPAGRDCSIGNFVFEI